MTAGQTSLFAPEQAPEPLLCWLWLAKVLGPGSLHAKGVLDGFGDGQEAWRARGTAEFRQLAGDAAAKRAVQLDPASFAPVVRCCEKKNIRILPADHRDYPRQLRRTPDLPVVLYCTGDPVWLNEPARVGMVGSRVPTPYGVQAAEDIGGTLARNGAIIVSGLADGLDSAGHRAAVKNHSPTIGVLGVPIDRTYPVANRDLRRRMEENGCVISEYPPLHPGVGANGFLQRNRLIAGLSAALVVVEAREKSGTMSTVAHAQRYGIPVYAVPGSIYSENSAGTNGLLREGQAKAACRAEDLMEDLGLRFSAAKPAAPRQPQPVGDTERLVLDHIGARPTGVEELRIATGLSTAELLSTLMKLQLTGRVNALPGQRYILR